MSATHPTRGERLNIAVTSISRQVSSTYPPDLDDEAHLWRRCAKVCEEAGEVIEALLGLAGENPRKGITADVHKLEHELLDVAVAALGAVSYLAGDNPVVMSRLLAHAEWVDDRLISALGGRTR